MTVCIAAVCNDGKAAVVCADRMVTAGPPMNLEFEHERSKIVTLLSNCAVMTAGDALTAADIVRTVTLALQQHPGLDVEGVATQLVNAYAAARLARVEEQLRSLGYTQAMFHAEGLKQLGQQVHAAVLQQIQSLNLGVELLVAGFTGDEARITYVHHPGTNRWYDPLGFHATGSGGMHASMSLIASRYSRTLPVAQALFQVYRAKVNAEAAPGVGHETDMIVLTQGTPARRVTPACYDEMRKLHEQISAPSAVDFTKLAEAIDAKP